MSNRLTALEKAEKIVSTLNRVHRLESILNGYSYKELDGKQYNVANIGDGRHFKAGQMISTLPTEDQQAINSYIVKKTRAAIRNGKQELKLMGVK